MKILKYICLFALIIGFTSCEEDDITSGGDGNVVLPPLDAGSADFSNYVALGNSLSAGFSDGTVFLAAQEASYPNILASKMALDGGGEFVQPLVSDNFGGLALAGNRIAPPRLVFGGPENPVLPLESVIGPVTVTTDIALNNPTGPFNNMAVPGARSFHLLAPGYGNIANLPAANPYFVRMTGSTPNATILELAAAQAPTFFSLWIGANDVLGYATSGGDPNLSTITDQATFDAALGAVVATMAASASGGAIANIPNVTLIPFFNAIPHNPLDPSNPDFGPQIPVLNATFAQLNQAYAFLGVPERSVVFSETEASPVVIHDESIPDIGPQLAQVLIGGGLDPITAGLLASQYGQSRQATENDLLTLTSAGVVATLNEEYFNTLLGLGVDPATAGQLSINGITFPLEDRWVLLPSEAQECVDAVNNFNASIEAIANQFGLAFVDANAIINQAATTGYMFDDYLMNMDLVFGGLVSLDGVHPTSRGYALVASEFMKAIDATYGSNFEESGNLPKAGDYPTNYSPLLQ